MSDINKNMTPPVIEIGVLGWMKKNLFSTWYNTVLTLIGLYFIYVIIPPFQVQHERTAQALVHVGYSLNKI